MLVSRWSEPGWEPLYEANRKGEQLSEGTSCPRGWAGPLASCFSTLCAPRSKTKPASPSSLRNNTCHTHTHSPHLLLSSSRPLFLLPCSFSILSSACFSAALSFSFIISCSPSAHILICSFPPAYFHPLFYSASSLLFFSLFPPHFLYANDFRHLFPLLHSHLLFTSSSSLVLYFMLVLHTF